MSSGMEFANAVASLIASARPRAFVAAAALHYPAARCLPAPTVASGSPPVTAAWTYLIVAGLFEIGWPLGLKWAQEARDARGTIIGIVVAVVTMAVSGWLLYLAQKEIALGTSYAVWTGIGAAGTFLVGVWFFGD